MGVREHKHRLIWSIVLDHTCHECSCDCASLWLEASYLAHTGCDLSCRLQISALVERKSRYEEEVSRLKLMGWTKSHCLRWTCRTKRRCWSQSRNVSTGLKDSLYQWSIGMPFVKVLFLSPVLRMPPKAPTVPFFVLPNLWVCTKPPATRGAPKVSDDTFLTTCVSRSMTTIPLTYVVWSSLTLVSVPPMYSDMEYTTFEEPRSSWPFK